MLVLMLISVAVLLIGWLVGFEKGGAWPVDLMFIWTYVMIGLAAVAIIVIGGYISAKNDSSFLKKIGLVVGGTAILVVLVYLISPGKPAVGMLEQPAQATLKLTDTILNLTYLFGGAAILSIVCGGIIRKILDKKQK